MCAVVNCPVENDKKQMMCCEICTRPKSLTLLYVLSIFLQVPILKQTLALDCVNFALVIAI